MASLWLEVRLARATVQPIKSGVLAGDMLNAVAHKLW
jgi:hypothetical protein